MNNPFHSLQKGTITQLEVPKDQNNDYTRARIAPNNARDSVTRPIVIPYWLRGQWTLTPGTEVVYAVFDDATGIILSRADGEKNVYGYE